MREDDIENTVKKLIKLLADYYRAGLKNKSTMRGRSVVEKIKYHEQPVQIQLTGRLSPRRQNGILPEYTEKGEIPTLKGEEKYSNKQAGGMYYSRTDERGETEIKRQDSNKLWYVDEHGETWRYYSEKLKEPVKEGKQSISSGGGSTGGGTGGGGDAAAAAEDSGSAGNVNVLPFDADQQIYSGAEAENVSTPNVQPDSLILTTEAQPEAIQEEETFTHHIGYFDGSLDAIAKKYGTEPEILKELNGLTSKNIKAETALLIPRSTLPENVEIPTPPAVRTKLLTGGDYEVQAGEGLLDIAKKFKINIGELIKWNKLDHRNPSLLKGDWIYLGNPEDYKELPGRKGTIYIQVMLNSKEPLVDKEIMDSVKRKIEEKGKELNVGWKVKVVYSNDIMSREKFQNRPGADDADSYILISTRPGLEHFVNNRNVQEGFGWQNIAPKKFHNVAGTSTWDADVNMHYVNINYVPEMNPLNKFNKLDDKLYLAILHEDGHPKFKDYEKNRGNNMAITTPENGIGHVLVYGNIMSEGSSIGDDYNEDMVKMLQRKHGVLPD